jgi:hypothetical protein
VPATGEEPHAAAAGRVPPQPHAAAMLQQQQQQQQVAAVPRAPLQPLQLQGLWDQPRSSSAHKLAWGSGVVQQPPQQQPPSTVGEGATGRRRLPRLQPLTPLPMADLEGSPSPSPLAQQQQHQQLQVQHYAQQQQQQQVELQQGGAPARHLPSPAHQMTPAVVPRVHSIGAAGSHHPAAVAGAGAALDAGVGGGKPETGGRRRKLPKLHPLCGSGRQAGETRSAEGCEIGAGRSVPQLQQPPAVDIDVDRQQMTKHCKAHTSVQQQQQQVASVVTMAPEQQLLRLELGEPVLSLQVAGPWALLVTASCQPQQAHAALLPVGHSMRHIRLHLLHWAGAACGVVPVAPSGSLARLPQQPPAMAIPQQQHQHQQPTKGPGGTSSSSSMCQGLSLAAVAWACLDLPCTHPAPSEDSPLAVHLLPVAVHPAAAPATGGSGQVPPSSEVGGLGNGVLLAAAGGGLSKVGARQDQDAPYARLCVYQMSAGPCSSADRAPAEATDTQGAASAAGGVTTGPTQGSHLRCVQVVPCSGAPTALTSCSWALAAGGMGPSICCWGLLGRWSPPGHTTGAGAAGAADGVDGQPMASGGHHAAAGAAAGAPCAAGGGPLLEPVQLQLPGGLGQPRGCGQAVDLVSSTTSSHVAAMCFCGAPSSATVAAGAGGRTGPGSGPPLRGLLLVAATSAGALCVWDVGHQQLLHHAHPFAGVPRQLLPLPWPSGEGLAARGSVPGSSGAGVVFCVLAAVQRPPAGMPAPPQAAKWQTPDGQQPHTTAAAGGGAKGRQAASADLTPLLIQRAAPAAQQQQPCAAVVTVGRPYPLPSGVVAAAVGSGTPLLTEDMTAGPGDGVGAQALQCGGSASSRCCRQLAALLPDSSMLIWDAAGQHPATGVQVVGAPGASSVAQVAAAASADLEDGGGAGGTGAARGQMAWLGGHHVMRALGHSVDIIRCTARRT